jgi:hypothetical protein
MNFLFHTAIGINSEMAYYNVFHVGGGKFKLELQDRSFHAADLSSEIVIWKNLRGWQTANRQDELIAQYVGEEIEQYRRAH